MNILLVKLKHIGDVLLMTPAIRHLKKVYPNCRIKVLIRGGTEVSLAGNPDIDEVFVVGKLGEKARKVDKMIANMRLLKWLVWGNKFDLSIDFSTSDRGAICSWLSGARRRFAYEAIEGGFKGKEKLYTDIVPAGDPFCHQVEKDLCLASQATGGGFAREPLCYHIDAGDQAWASRFWSGHFGEILQPKKRVVCHTTSRWMFKCWHEDRWIELVKRLIQDDQAQVVLTAGNHPDEVQMVERIRKGVDSLHCVSTTQQNFGQLAGLMQTANLYLGIDTAPSHLAAAVGVPTVVLFGPSDYRKWGPWSLCAEALHHHCKCQVQQNLVCPKSEVMRCLSQVSVDEVLEAADKVVEQKHRLIFSNN